MSNIQIFEHPKYSKIKVIFRDEKPWFVAKDIATTLGFRDSNDMTKYLDKDDFTTCPDNSSGQVRHISIINECGLYAAIFRSRKEEARQFTKWVTSEVLPAIRKTGGYVKDNKLFIDTYLPFADDNTKIMFNAVLNLVKNQNKMIERQHKTVVHKEDVINGLTSNISLADKRQIINRIVTQARGNYKDRWNALYREFDAKFHMNVRSRLNNYNRCNKPKLKNPMEFIDKVLGKIPELFDIACKLYEGEVESLIQGLHLLRNKDTTTDVAPDDPGDE